VFLFNPFTDKRGIMIELGKDNKDLLKEAIQLSIQVVDEQFGRIEDIRKKYSDREEVEFQKNMKLLTYEVILGELVKRKFLS
jgi:hypothetical protein